MGNNVRKIDWHSDYGGNEIRNSSLNTELIRFIFPDIDTEAGQIYTIELSAIYAYDILYLKAKSDTGTISLSIKINGTAVTGLSEVDVTSTTGTFTPTALYSVTVGDVVTLTIDTLASSPTALTGTIVIKR